MNTSLKKRLHVRGFIVGQDYGHRYEEFYSDMSRWVESLPRTDG